MMMLGALPTFTRLFPNFQEQCGAVHKLLLPVAAVLLVAGIVAQVQHLRSGRPMLQLIGSTAVIVMCIAFYGDWTDMATDAMQTIVHKMDAAPEKSAQRYLEVLVAKENPKEKSGWFGLPSSAQMSEAILWGFLSMIGLLAQFLMWGAYVLQKFFLGLSYAFAPIFLGMLAVRSTSHIGSRYILGSIGIIAWPLGWAAASIGTSNLIDLATEQGLVVVGNAYGLQTILAGAVIGGWIIITTLIAPVIIQNAVTSGAQVGGALIGGAITAATAAISSGASGAVGVGAGGAGVAGMSAAAGVGAAGSLAGSAIHGGGPPMSGNMSASIAQAMQGGRGASAVSSGSPGDVQRKPGGNEKSGGSGASALNQAPFNSADPCNDAEAQSLTEPARQTGERK